MHPYGVVIVSQQGRKDTALAARFLQAIVDVGAKCRLRSDLDEEVRTQILLHLPDCLSKLYWLPDIIPPVVAVKSGAIESTAGHCGIEGSCCRLGLQTGKRRANIRFDPIHGVAMKCIVEIKPSPGYTTLIEHGFQIAQCLGRPGNGHAERAVDRCDA
ncbi:MAG: hypothetical protein JW395_1340 [Nitrospira sp.]|nr:hypothetical protein [Nitrospira sp.]